MIFAIRKEVLHDALADPETWRKIGGARDLREVYLVLAEFAEKRGFKVACLEEEEKKRIHADVRSAV